LDFDQVVKIIDKITAPLKRRVSLMVGRAVLSAAVDDSTQFQTIQADVLADETLDGLERIQNYGFTGVPFEDAEAVIVFPQGNRDHGLVICVDDRRFRLKALKNGEVAMYTDEGDKIHLKRGGIIHVDSSNIELGKGSIEKIIKGETFQTLFNSHVHIGDSGYNTTTPTIPLTGTELSLVTKTE